MSKENKSRDWFDIIDLISRLAIPIVIGFLGWVVNYQLSAATRDVDVVQRFSSLYYYEGAQDSRRLSVYYIRLINNKQTRYELRKFVIWDTLEKNSTNGFSFNSEFLDWHLMGDTLLDMAIDDNNDAKIFWCDLKSTALERWQSQEMELSKLFDWIDNTYKKNDANWKKCT